MARAVVAAVDGVRAKSGVFMLSGSGVVAARTSGGDRTPSAMMYAKSKNDCLHLEMKAVLFALLPDDALVSSHTRMVRGSTTKRRANRTSGINHPYVPAPADSQNSLVSRFPPPA